MITRYVCQSRLIVAGLVIAVASVFLFQSANSTGDPQVPQWQVGQAIYYKIKNYHNEELVGEFYYRLAIVERDETTGQYWLEADMILADPKKQYFSKRLMNALEGLTLRSFMESMEERMKIYRYICQAGERSPIEMPWMADDDKAAPDYKIPKEIQEHLQATEESVVCPAGTFSSTRYSYVAPEKSAPSQTAFNVWVSGEVPVLGVARYEKTIVLVSPVEKKTDIYRSEVLLDKIDSGAVSYITRTATVVKPYGTVKGKTGKR